MRVHAYEMCVCAIELVMNAYESDETCDFRLIWVLLPLFNIVIDNLEIGRLSDANEDLFMNNSNRNSITSVMQLLHIKQLHD